MAMPDNFGHLQSRVCMLGADLQTNNAKPKTDEHPKELEIQPPKILY
jgi:hypothetical protein